MREMVENLIKESSVLEKEGLAIKEEMVIAPFYVNGKELSAENLLKLRNNTLFKNSIYFLLSQLAPQPMNLNTFAIMLTPNIPITCLGSEKFIPIFRKVIQNYTSQFAALGIDCFEYGFSISFVDAVDSLFKSFPMVMGVTGAVIFCI